MTLECKFKLLKVAKLGCFNIFLLLPSPRWQSCILVFIRQFFLRFQFQSGGWHFFDFEAGLGSGLLVPRLYGRGHGSGHRGGGGVETVKIGSGQKIKLPLLLLAQARCSRCRRPLTPGSRPLALTPLPLLLEIVLGLAQDRDWLLLLAHPDTQYILFVLISTATHMKIVKLSKNIWIIFAPVRFRCVKYPLSAAAGGPSSVIISLTPTLHVSQSLAWE